MTYEQKLALAAEFRAGTELETGLMPENTYDKMKIRRESAHPNVPPSPPVRRKTSHEKRKGGGCV